MKFDEESVVSALQRLREQSVELQAPPRVEQAVLASFRNRPPRRGRPWIWIGAAAASVIAGWWWQPGPLTPKPQQAPVVITQQVPVEKQPVVAVKPVRRRPRRRIPAVQKEEVAEFIPVPFAPPLQAEDGAQVVRVKLPGSSFRMFGIPVDEERQWDRVNTDVMLGQDGIVRAVRFMK